MGEQLALLVLMVIASTIILFCVIYCIIRNFAKKITDPILVLTDFTNQLKKKQSIEEKQAFVNEIKEMPIFETLNKLWQAEQKDSPETQSSYQEKKLAAVYEKKPSSYEKKMSSIFDQEAEED